MAHKDALEVVDRLLKYLMDSEEPFCGKVMVLGGDFWQVLPVITKATPPQIVNAWIVASYLWRRFHLIRFTTNVRASGDPEYQQFLLKVLDGAEPNVLPNTILLPASMVIRETTEEEALESLIDHTFPNLQTAFNEPN